MAGVAKSVSPIRETLMNRNERPSADIQRPMPCFPVGSSASPETSVPSGGSRMTSDSMPETRLDSGDDGPCEQRPVGDRRVERNARQAVTVCAWWPLAVEASIRWNIGPAGSIEYPRNAREFN